MLLVLIINDAQQFVILGACLPEPERSSTIDLPLLQIPRIKPQQRQVVVDFKGTLINVESLFEQLDGLVDLSLFDLLQELLMSEPGQIAFVPFDSVVDAEFWLAARPKGGVVPVSGLRGGGEISLSLLVPFLPLKDEPPQIVEKPFVFFVEGVDQKNGR